MVFDGKMDGVFPPICIVDFNPNDTCFDKVDLLDEFFVFAQKGLFADVFALAHACKGFGFWIAQIDHLPDGGSNFIHWRFVFFNKE